MTTKTIIITASTILLLLFIICGAFYYIDHKRANTIGNLNQQIVAMDTTITNDKAVVATLKEKLSTQTQAIVPLATKAASNKVHAQQNLTQLEQEKPTEKADLEAATSPFQLALTDEEATTKATETALETSGQENQAQQQVITDQDTQIASVKTALTDTTKELQTQTTRKKWYRSGFIATTTTILIHVLLHF
jgi:chromosome segregation ATPase